MQVGPDHLKALVNAHVYLGGGESIERGFVVFRGPRIEEVGPVSAFGRRPGHEITDLGGKLLLPGLTDCHLHLVPYSIILSGLDLADTYSLEEGLARIRSYIAGLPGGRLAGGAWLRGRGWDKQRWGLAGFPKREMLDGIAPDNPVALNSRDGHLVWVNSYVIDRFGLADMVGEVEGGEIETDAAGRPTGILKENAVQLVARHYDEPGEAEAAGAVGAGCEKLASLGLTGVHTVVEPNEARVLDAAARSGNLTLNCVRMLEVHQPAEIEALTPERHARFVKIFMDGALGSQTAGMVEPYCGDPGNRGILTTSRADLEKMVMASLERGFSLAVHAIGDRANKQVLDVFDRARGAVPGSKSILRVEHAQVLRDEDIPRFGELAVIASMQPIHLVGDMDVADRYWGDRSRNAYAFRAIAASGGKMAFGSDAPIEDPNPLKGIHAAVTRLDPGRPTHPAWYPEQCLTVAEALDCYTVNAAAAAGEGGQAGAIRPGLRADFTVLDRDILTDPDPNAILDTGVAMTVVGGHIITPA